jgi:hypothetical protein
MRPVLDHDGSSWWMGNTHGGCPATGEAPEMRQAKSNIEASTPRRHWRCCIARGFISFPSSTQPAVGSCAWSSGSLSIPATRIAGTRAITSVGGEGGSSSCSARWGCPWARVRRPSPSSGTAGLVWLHRLHCGPRCSAGSPTSCLRDWRGDGHGYSGTPERSMKPLFQVRPGNSGNRRGTPIRPLESEL